jgi:2-dehydro-3-deoxyphosphogluconate aldolase / (4S)-4-hydroxy-2-oxoglutarate aldolase
LAAGTLPSPQDIQAAGVGSVSPGATYRLPDACEEADLPLLPGAATASEAMRLLERGYTVQKFFPAEPSGGAKALSAIGAGDELILRGGFAGRSCRSVSGA